MGVGSSCKDNSWCYPELLCKNNVCCESFQNNIQDKQKKQCIFSKYISKQWLHIILLLCIIMICLELRKKQ